MSEDEVGPEDRVDEPEDKTDELIREVRCIRKFCDGATFVAICVGVGLLGAMVIGMILEIVGLLAKVSQH